ncbi:hypothetical protein SK128_020814 [Halocaridina rubra]|uniref:MADF domain-containing protein n=1 Tax=Halocaridina rubra TaxID=373956 RepID=A0AAN8ZTL6_HALRR
MAPLTWGRRVEHTLIELVREQPTLWNISHPEYPKKLVKKELYRQIASILKAKHPHTPDITPENVQTKFANLRTSFKRELKKIRMAKNGSTDRIESTDSQWPPFESMMYLIDVDEPGLSYSTITFEAEEVKFEEDSPDLILSVYKEEEASSPLDSGSSGRFSEDMGRAMVESVKEELYEHPMEKVNREYSLTLTSSQSPSQTSFQTPTRLVQKSPSGSSRTPSPTLSKTPVPVTSNTQTCTSMCTPSKKRKREHQNIESQNNMQNALKLVGNALADLKTKKGIPACCGVLVESTCERLPLMRQYKLLQKLSLMMEQELMEAGVSE